MPLRIHIPADAAEEAGPLQPGEVRIASRVIDGAERRDVSSLTLEQGASAFECGAEPITVLRVPREPTLDDLLAAALIERQLEGGTPPAGIEHFTRYASLVREGLRPAPEIPLELSLEGMFAAIRRTAGDDLGQPVVCKRFLEGWRRLEQRIFEAAEEGLDPCSAVLFDGPSFTRERAFLKDDEQLFRQDVRRGQRWKVSLPGGPSDGEALLLDRPKSLLFKHWSRSKETSPGPEAIVFLAVDWHEGNWVFSTDPVHRLHLEDLANRLQEAERATAGRRGEAAGEWFDGAPFGHTLVAAPKGGTRLTDREVIALVRRWTRARSPERPRLRWAAISMALLLSSATMAFLLSPLLGGAGDVEDRGLTALSPPPEASAPFGPGRIITLSVGISDYQDDDYDLDYADHDARELAKAFEQVRSPLFRESVSHVVVDEQATKDGILTKLDDLLASGDRPTQQDLLVVTLAGHGKLDDNGYFFFLPHDYDEGQRPESTAIFWEDFRRRLGHLPCKVLVVIDACHSGSVSDHLGLRGDVKTSTEGLARQAVKGWSESKAGLIVMLSSLGSQSSRERDTWGHGAFSLAFIESLQGRHLVSPRETALPDGTAGVSLAHISSYVSDRVRELSLGIHGSQDVVTAQTGGIALGSLLLTSPSN